MNSNIIVLTKENFEGEVLKSAIPVLVDFWAGWCMPCKMIAPVIEQLADQHVGKLKVAKLDVDKYNEIASKYGISSIPAVFLFKGGVKVDEMIGARPKTQFDEMLKKYI